ncbi:MAG: DUF6531 domain-containing protein [Anaerolineae bacterium]|nr:DUF6531 domain-containing protein [Anaerolineae bacterium]
MSKFKHDGNELDSISEGQSGPNSGMVEIHNQTLIGGTLRIYGHMDTLQTGPGYLRHTAIRIWGTGVNIFGSSHSGTSDCPFCYNSRYATTSSNPLSLKDGEKREKVTDLSVNTPTGVLAFTRSYRQSKNIADPVPSTPEDGFTTPLGAGWTHNHDIRIFTHSSYANKLLLKMPSGGIAHFTQVGITDIYDGDPGSNSSIDASGGVNDKYTLTSSDESLWVFDDTGKLRSRTWSNGEVWTYSYYSTGFASGLLKSVSDGYDIDGGGQERGLQFAYIDNSTGFNDLQLKYVGDHTVTDITTPTAGERYVEFAYTENKKDSSGTVIDGGQALLDTVTDILGEGWTYTYETIDLDALNWIIGEDSPSVDVDGDDKVDATNRLKELVYTVSDDNIQYIIQKRGKYDGATEFLSIADFAFQANGYNVTTETIGGREAIHRFNGALYTGSTDPSGDTWVTTQDASFRPANQQDANGNATQLDWSADGKKLNSVTDADANTTSFDYDSSDRLIKSTDAEGRITEYTYDDMTYPNLRQPAEIKVKDTGGTTVLRHQKFTYDGKGRTTIELLLDPSDGSTVLQETRRTFGISGNENGLLKTIVQKNVEAAGVDETTTTYTYDAQGRVIKTSKSSLMGTCQYTYTVYDNAGNVLGSACGLVNTTAPTKIKGTGGLLELYNASDTTKKHTRITTHTYDEMGRRVTTKINDATTFSRTSRTLYDSLSRVIRTIDNYVVQGASKPGAWVWSSTNQRWEYSASDTTAVSYDTDNDENIISDTDYNERGLVYRRRDVLGRVTLYGYDLADRLVKTVQNALSADYNASYTDGDPDLSRYVADSSSVDSDVITEQSYDANGNLVKTIDARGSVSYTVYDVLNRPTRTIQNAKAAATIDLNAGDTGYAAINDPRSTAYALSTAPDEDVISETTYDKMGRVVTSRRLLENRDTSIAPIWDENYVVYDELGRQKFTVQHYVAASPEVTPDNWVYDNGQWEDGSSNAINHGNNDQNILASETIYDATGRVKETVNINRRVTRFVYDGLNRQVMTIANYVEQGNPVVEPENWAWSSINDQWEYSTGNAVSHGINNDENIITKTEYDGDGRVLETRNVEGLLQRNAYDTAGRSYLSVSNYVAATPEVTPDNWQWVSTQWEDGSSLAIDRGAGYVQNIISQPEYDDENRVFQTRDARGNLTRQVYDEAGRRVMTISNFVAQATEPENWVWRAVTSVFAWRLSATDDTLVDFGTDNDQNRISQTTYDILGRVINSRDALGRESYTVYDALRATHADGCELCRAGKATRRMGMGK